MEDVAFRFVPDPHQVERALEVRCGGPLDGCPGWREVSAHLLHGTAWLARPC